MGEKLSYYEQKKRDGYIFTLHNIDPSLPYENIDQRSGKPWEEPDGPSWWDKERGRYRTAEEQKEYVRQLEIKGAIFRSHLERLPDGTYTSVGEKPVKGYV